MKKSLDDVTEEEYMEMSKQLAEAQFATAIEREHSSQPKVLAEEHWEWIKKLLDTQLLVTERLFKDGFKHGWKHAKGATCSTKKT